MFVMAHASTFLATNARTLSGVIWRVSVGGSGIGTAGSLRIETFEGSRSRLGQTRAIIGI
jgi:hypothetical protein